jgi:hypothetical protein
MKATEEELEEEKNRPSFHAQGCGEGAGGGVCREWVEVRTCGGVEVWRSAKM